MNTHEKLSLIDRYEQAIDPLIDFAKRLPAGVVDFRPMDRSDAWTIREHAIHMLDAESFGYGRIRLAVAQPGSRVFAWEEEIWQKAARYETADAIGSLETARGLRKPAAAMLRAIAEEDWAAFFIDHPARGRMELAQVVETYIGHAKSHLDYFGQNLAAYEKTKG